MHTSCLTMDILISILCGFLAGLLPSAGLARKLWNLQCDVAHVQAQLLKERNARAANTRWKDKELLDELTGAAEDPKKAVPLKNVDPLAKFRRA